MKAARVTHATAARVQRARPRSSDTFDGVAAGPDAQFRALFECFPQPVIVYERATLGIVAVSDAAIACYGYSREEFVAMTIGDLVPAEDVDSFQRFHDRHRAAEAPGLFANSRRRHRCKDGSMIDVEITGSDVEADGRSSRLLVCERVRGKDDASPELARALGQLRASEQRYQELFEHNPQPMVAFDRETLGIIAASDAMVAAFGYSRDELESMTIEDLVLAEDVKRLRSYLAATPSGSRPGRVGAPTEYPSRRRRKDGTVIEVEVLSENIELAGRACRLALYVDVTERNRAMVELEDARDSLRAGEERYRMLFEQNPLPMVAYDRRTLEILDVSDALVRKYGYSREELASMSITDLVPPEDVAMLLDYIAKTPGGSRPEFAKWNSGYPNRHQLKDGTVIDIEVTSNSIELNGRPVRFAHIEDVTYRNKAAAELAAARDAAVEASNMKSAFLANMSHEIRTPMNGVIGLNELLLDTELTEAQRYLAEQAAQSGEHLLAVINDILDVSKIEAGRLELDVTEFDLHATIEQTCSTARVQLSAKGVRFDLHIDPAAPQRVHGDQGRIRQVLTNLLSNASKFTAEGVITVHVGAGPESKVRIEVSDTGIGIDPEALSDMFEPFTQADVTTTRLYGGTGLGLAIARELVGLMDGTIGAHSNPGRGSTFWFEFPLSAPTAEPAPSAGPSEPGSPTTTFEPTHAPPAALEGAPLVLVVEDSAINQTVAVLTLERCGCHAEVAGDGLQALAALEDKRYDVVFMDCQMPLMDGYQATAELRRRERETDRHTPVIAMTAHAMTGDRERCLQAGMDDYLTKPIRPQRLTEILDRWIPTRTATNAATGT